MLPPKWPIMSMDFSAAGSLSNLIFYDDDWTLKVYHILRKLYMYVFILQWFFFNEKK